MSARPGRIPSVGMTVESIGPGIEETGDVAAVAARLARATLADLDAVTDRLVAEILSENPDYYEAALVSEPDLRTSCRSNIERVLQLLGECVTEGEDPYDAAKRTGRRRAEQRVALDLVLRSFRLGGRVVWSSALDAARRESDVEPEMLLDVATSIWTVVDAVSSSVADSYRRTELEMLRADEQRRRVLIDELLRGAGEDPAFADEALRTLGLSTEGAYAVVAAEDGQGSIGLLEPEEALACHGLHSVWQTRSGALIGIVAIGDRSVEEVAAALGRKIRAKVGVSPAVPRCAGIPQARELALVALRTIPPGVVRTVSLDDYLPQALLARSPDLADRLVDRTLGPVLALPQGERELLLTTLATWLDADCSAKATAGRLYCHRNTVLNRLSRIESLLGPVHGAQRCVWLSLALQARTLRSA